jgi:hypothetical protein
MRAPNNSNSQAFDFDDLAVGPSLIELHSVDRGQTIDTKNSAPSPHTADNMSWKSGFSKGLSLEGPGIECELPHHIQALRWRGLV